MEFLRDTYDFVVRIRNNRDLELDSFVRYTPRERELI